MNYSKAKKIAYSNYKKDLQKIDLAKNLYDSIRKLLPDGWNCFIDNIVFHLVISKDVEDGTDSGEFKLVCGLVEKVIGKKLERKVDVNCETNEIRLLKADAYFYKKNITKHLEDIFCGTSVEIYLHNPKNLPECNLKWETHTIRKPIVSSKCLGLNGE